MLRTLALVSLVPFAAFADKSQSVTTLPTAVEWQVNSKEYQFLSSAVYAQATAAVNAKTDSKENWIAVLDVDETVLDNSQYQVELELSGSTYTSESWAAWVKREEATLVPGVEGFISALFESGGKLALVTNRNRALDASTWSNLKKMGLPVTPENTCLIGRSPEDVSQVGSKGIVNDKDLRRQQLTQGVAPCYSEAGQKSASWEVPAAIQMQIGDNIEDFAGVTQENADIKALLPKWNSEYFLLPNPMYGSWQ